MDRLLNETTMLQPESVIIENDTRYDRLLSFVNTGHTILSQLFELANNVPEPFIVATTGNRSNNSNWKESEQLIHHFGYFKEAEVFEAKINANQALKEADEKLYDIHFSDIQRFYLTFESIQKYANNLNKFVADLEEESGQSVLRLLQDELVCRHLCEAYFLLGYSLLTADRQFEGTLRERILVSYYRYSSSKSSTSSLLDSTCNLLRTTGFRCAEQQPRDLKAGSYCRPNDYPGSLLERLNVDTTMIELLITRLVTVDLYDQTSLSFPHPEHRSSAFSKQASIALVLLYFSPSILKNDKRRMREITNKFFHDNWVINLYLGNLVNLFEEWTPFPAAKEAFMQMFESTGSIERLAKENRYKFDVTQTKLASYLSQGWLDKSSVLQHHTKILDCIRDANVLLKWLLLHSNHNSDWLDSNTKTAHSIVVKHLPSKIDLYNFLQSLADLENKFVEIYCSLLKDQQSTIQALRAESILLLEELISIFNDSKPVLWVQAGGNSKLSSLLTDLKLFIEQHIPIHENQTDARDLFLKVTKMLDNYKETYTDGKSLQVNQLFTVIRESLIHIVKLLGLTGGIKLILNSVSDFSYGWRLMDSTFTEQIQELIRNNPVKVQAVESTFKKLLPVLNKFSTDDGSNQFDSFQDENFTSVVTYYSTKLTTFIRHVLQVFPETILKLVVRMGELQRNIARKENCESYSKITLDSLKDYSCADSRKEILCLTCKVSQYAESMLTMQDIEIGRIILSPKQLLNDGIREELSKKIRNLIKDIPIPVNNNNKNSRQSLTEDAQQFHGRIELLHDEFNNYRVSIEYVQEYLSIHGVQIWNEELDNIFKNNLEQVHKVLMNLETDEKNENENILVQLLSIEQFKSNLITTLLQDLLHLTDPRTTIYDEQMNSWYVQSSPRAKVIDMNIFDFLASTFGPVILSSIDEVCCLMLKKKLESIGRFLISIRNNDKFLSETLNQLDELENYQYGQLANRQSSKKLFASLLSKIAPHSVKFINHLLKIGQLQAIRTNISLTLSSKSHCEARHVYNCLERLDSCLLSAIRQPRNLPSKQKASSSSSKSSLVSDDELAFSSQHEDYFHDKLLATQEVASTNEARYWDELDEHNSLLVMLQSAFERVGLSEPATRLYTLNLTSTTSSCDTQSSSIPNEKEHLVGVEELIFLILLDQCSKFKFSLAISGFIPRETKSLFHESTPNVDAQPLFYGLSTLINHLQPYIFVDDSLEDSQFIQFNPLLRVLKLGSLYVNLMMMNNNQSDTIFSARSQNLTPEMINMILAMIELIRLSQQSPDYLLSNSHLPKFIYDTFQFIIFHLSWPAGSGNKTTPYE